MVTAVFGAACVMAMDSSTLTLLSAPKSVKYAISMSCQAAMTNLEVIYILVLDILKLELLKHGSS